MTLTAIDPVCGMTIDVADAAATSRYADQTFHFCAEACKASFERHPDRYATAAEPVGATCCSPGGHCSGK